MVKCYIFAINIEFTADTIRVNYRYYRKSIISIVALLSILPAIAYAGEFPRFLRSEPGQFVERLGQNARINWTAGFIAATVSVPLPRIVFDPQNPDFEKPGTALTIYDARSEARDMAMERASILLTNAVLSLRLDSMHSIREMMVRNDGLRRRMGDLTSRFVTRTRQTGEGFVSLELALPLYRKDGLYGLLLDRSYGEEEVPVVSSEGERDSITGLIIDTTELPEFKTSLGLRVYTDQGRQIFGPEMIHPSYARHRGPYVYYTDSQKARFDSRLGLSPYYVFAAGTRGPHNSDVFLDSEDAARILSSKSGREALRKGAIVFIVSSTD